MADDPHRDLLPFKDGGCINTGRSSVIDQRERHSVCKLDRYQLEDRYLRLLDEVQELKKLSNTQEDKIKRLATKLMRVAATPRSCLPQTLDVTDRNRVEYLEHENAKLNDKITVLKNQILNHKIGRSRSRSRRLQIYPSSDPATSRSEIGRIKSSSSHLTHDLEDDKEARNNFLRIEELELEKKEMNSRIAELESQLDDQQAEKQREKTAENVEIIRVWRQMKQQNEQLVAAQALNVSLTEQIRELTHQLDDKTKNVKEITSALTAEKERFAEMDEQFAKAKSSQLSIREKDEQIKDLIGEMKILQQHNSELIAITSKHSQVEQENIELKKAIAEHLANHRSLKSAFTNEQTNMTALQAANEQLMKKLHDFQKNIDSLTIQLKSFQSQNERQEKSEPEVRIIRTVDRETSTDQPEMKPTENVTLDRELMCNNCSLASGELPKSQRKNTVNREIQTDDEASKNFRDSRPEVAVKKSPKRVIPRSPIGSDRAFQPDNGSVSLLPEEMLKLLEQAQINVPPEMKDSARTKHISSPISNEFLMHSAEPNQSRAYDVKSTARKKMDNCLTRKRHRSEKISDTSECKCRGDDNCNGKNDCGNSCSQSIARQEILESDDNFERHGNFIRNPFRNVVSDFSAPVEKTCDDIHTSRRVRADGTLGECYKSWQISNGIKNEKSGTSSGKECIVCKKSQRNFSDEQTEQRAVKKSWEDDAENDSNSKSIPNDLPCIRCCDDCRSGESLNKIESFVNSSNTQEDTLSDSSKLQMSDAKEMNKIENGSSISSPEILPPDEKGQPLKVLQVNHRNDVNEGISSLLEEELVHGRKKNSESRRESLVDSYLSTSLENSDTSVIQEMEDEDSTSEDLIKGDKERRTGGSTEKGIEKIVSGSRENDTDKADTDSVKEFNRLIRNNIILSPRDSCSSVQDLSVVFSDDNWQEYKRRSIAGQASYSRSSAATSDEKSAISHLRTGSSFRGKNTIIIRIESLSLDHKCSLLEDPEIHQLYVEFSFLGYHGADLETISVPKPDANTTAYFNYMRKFEIDEDHHQMQRSILRAMMADDDNPTIKFTIVSEPLPEDMDTKECTEVGYAFFNVRHHVLSGGSHEVSLTISNLTQTETIGVLKITLFGVEVIRRCMSDLE